MRQDCEQRLGGLREKQQTSERQPTRRGRVAQSGTRILEGTEQEYECSKQRIQGLAEQRVQGTRTTHGETGEAQQVGL